MHVKVCQVYFSFSPFYVLTRGRWELTWAFPPGLARDKVRVEESRCGRTSQQYCSRVMVSRSQAQHTGTFRCRYQHRPRKQTSVYVYVAGKTLLHFFLFFVFFFFCISFSEAVFYLVSYSLFHPIMLIVYIPRLNRMWWVLNTDQCQRANYI